jgi:hypothetical protein
MGKEGLVQCQCCGTVHKTTIRNLSDDDLFIEQWCPRCRDETKHIYCGENVTDIYYYYNVNVDPRFY